MTTCSSQTNKKKHLPASLQAVLHQFDWQATPAVYQWHLANAVKWRSRGRVEGGRVPTSRKQDPRHAGPNVSPAWSSFCMRETNSNFGKSTEENERSQKWRKSSELNNTHTLYNICLLKTKGVMFVLSNFYCPLWSILMYSIVSYFWRHGTCGHFTSLFC